MGIEMNPERPDWDDYFMSITRLVATRAACLRRQVGAVLVKDHRILATGYNGAPSGLLHCTETGCLRQEMGIPSGERAELCRGVHAEQNVIVQCAVHGIMTEGAVLYCTTQPCSPCAKILINAKIKEVVYEGDYPDPLTVGLFEEAQVRLRQYA